MVGHRLMSQVEVLAVTDSGRRRRWTDAEKLRIVEESLSRPRIAAATARRYEISRALLKRWRKAYQVGLLIGVPMTSFTPMRISADPLPAPDATPTTNTAPDLIAITLVNGRRPSVSATIDPVSLVRLVAVLDPACSRFRRARASGSRAG